MKKLVLTTAWFAAWLAVSQLATLTNPLDYTGGRTRDERNVRHRNSSALATILGEFRTSLSDMMFLKTERYLHGGVAYMPHHDEPILTGEALADEIEHHQEHVGEIEHHDLHDEHSGIATIIPDAVSDFRGIIGHLHREVAPWRHPDRDHIHTDGRELLPWFRMMTAADPRYTRGYAVGAFWLQLEDLEQALDFITEGIQNNPQAFELYVSRGFLRVKAAREHGYVPETELFPEVRKWLELALEDFLMAIEIFPNVRPPDFSPETPASNNGDWDNYLENDALAACTMAVSLTRNLIGPSEAAVVAKRALAWFSDSEFLQESAQYP